MIESDRVEEVIGQVSFALEFPASLRERVAQAFCAVGEIEERPEGTCLFREGETGLNHGYVLLRGLVFVETESGFAAHIPAPALLGEMKQFEFDARSDRMANVYIADDAQLLRFDWDRFYAALDENVSEEERELFDDALEQYAWMHFLQIEDEL